MKRAMCWEEWQPRTIMTPQGAVFAEKGDVVVVLVAKTWDEALRALAKREPDER